MNSKMNRRGGHGRPLQERRGGGGGGVRPGPDNQHKLSTVQIPRMSFKCEVCADEPEDGRGIGGTQMDYNLWLKHLGGFAHQKKVTSEYYKYVRHAHHLDDDAYIMVGLPRFWNVNMLNELVNFFTEFGILTELMWVKHGFCYVILQPFSGKRTSSSLKGMDTMMSKTMLGDLPIRLYRKKRIFFPLWDQIYDGTIARELEESHKKKLLEEKETNSRENASSTNLVKPAGTNSAPFHTKQVTNVQQKPVANNFGNRRHGKENRRRLDFSEIPNIANNLRGEGDVRSKDAVNGSLDDKCGNNFGDRRHGKGNRPLDSSSDIAKPSKDASNSGEGDVSSKEGCLLQSRSEAAKSSKDASNSGESDVSSKENCPLNSCSEAAESSKDASNPVEADVLSKEAAIGNGSVDEDGVTEDSGGVTAQKASKDSGEDPEAVTVEKAGKDPGECLDSTEEAKPSNDTSNPVEADVLSKEAAIGSGSVDDNCVKEDSVTIQKDNNDHEGDSEKAETVEKTGEDAEEDSGAVPAQNATKDLGENSETVTVEKIGEDAEEDSGVVPVQNATKDLGEEGKAETVENTGKDAEEDSRAVPVQNATKDGGEDSETVTVEKVTVQSASKDSGEASDAVTVQSASKDSGEASDAVTVQSASKDSGEASDAVTVQDASKDSGEASEAVTVQDASKDTGKDSEAATVQAAPKDLGDDSEAVAVQNANKDLEEDSSGALPVQNACKDPGDDSQAETVQIAGKDPGDGDDSEAVTVQNSSKDAEEDSDAYRACDSADATDGATFQPAIDLPPPFPRYTFPDETSIIVRGGEEAGAEEPTTNSSSEEDTDPAAEREPDYMKYAMYWYRF